MASTFKRQLPLVLLGILSAAVIGWFLAQKPPLPVSAPAHREPEPSLSVLASAPDWTALEVYQDTITRADFETLLTTIFTTGQNWRNFIEIDDKEARIRTGAATEFFHLRFSTPEQTAKAPRHWRNASELSPAPADKPLEGIRIAIDAGHIGGEWAKMEERWFVLGTGSPVTEGDMTLHVAKLIKPKLEALGAIVSMVRDKAEPVTPLRPASLMSTLGESPGSGESPESLKKLAERLFYRTAEIRARAQLVNETLKPDLVLCLHFNAEAWGNPNEPTLIDRTHLHLLVNGAYNDEEVALADQRFALLQKLLQRTHEEEVKVGTTVADTFAQISGLPPYTYPADSLNARPVNGHPYLWARNLLANRLYDCPVIFMEPYVMNSVQDYNRIQAGDYEGLRLINGKDVPSIFNEYADGVVFSLEKYYRAERPAKNR